MYPGALLAHQQGVFMINRAADNLFPRVHASLDQRSENSFPIPPDKGNAGYGTRLGGGRFVGTAPLADSLSRLQITHLLMELLDHSPV